MDDPKPLSGRPLFPTYSGSVLAERWRVGERIGIGGMATVYWAEDLRLGRRVACKILHPHLADAAESRERLAREARAIAQVQHANIIEVYDYSTDDPRCTYLITELVEGGSLRDFLKHHGHPGVEVALMITGELLRALQAAHTAGVVHRDVKPDNVLIGIDGIPKLSDFGVAKVMAENRMTITGHLVGSPSYMSPEQADGRPCDPRADLFSVGVVLYQLITGVLPFRGQTAIETVRKVASGVYIDPVELEPSIEGLVATIVRRALAVKPEDRYPSAEAMLTDVLNASTAAGIESPTEALQAFFTSHITVASKGDPTAKPPAEPREAAERFAVSASADPNQPSFTSRPRARSPWPSESNALDHCRRGLGRGDGVLGARPQVFELSCANTWAPGWAHHRGGGRSRPSCGSRQNHEERQGCKRRRECGSRQSRGRRQNRGRRQSRG